MSEFKPKPGSFLPFLESTPRDKPASQSAPGSPLSLLEILSRQARHSLPIFDLQTLSGMDPSRYADALKSLRDAAWISIEGEAPEQVVRLTPNGAQAVQLARPA